MGGPDMGGLILYGACNGGPGIVRNVPNPVARISKLQYVMHNCNISHQQIHTVFPLFFHFI